MDKCLLQDHLILIPLEQLHTSRDSIRKAREAFLIHSLVIIYRFVSTLVVKMGDTFLSADNDPRKTVRLSVAKNDLLGKP